MKEADFSDMDMSSFTISTQLHQVNKTDTKTDTKIAEKVINLIQWYEVDSK